MRAEQLQEHGFFQQLQVFYFWSSILNPRAREESLVAHPLVGVRAFNYDLHLSDTSNQVTKHASLSYDRLVPTKLGLTL